MFNYFAAVYECYRHTARQDVQTSAAQVALAPMRSKIYQKFFNF